MSDRIRFTVDPNVVRTIAEDSFGGWETAFAEAIKNSIDAGASRIVIEVPARDIIVPHEQQRVVIQDNGRGMTRQELQDDYCRTGRMKRPGTAVFGRRGTGKVATFVVAGHVRLETWRDGQRLEIEFDTVDVLSSGGQQAREIAIRAFDHPRNDAGTRLTLEGFSQEQSPPAVAQVNQVLLRHFHHFKDRTFVVNDEQFVVENFATSLKRFPSMHLEGVGTIEGEVLLARQKIDHPGIVVYSAGQTILGPQLVGLEAKNYRGDTLRVANRTLGRIDLVPDDASLLHGGAWTLTRAFKVFEQWVGRELEQLVEQQANQNITEKVDRWLEDPPTRRFYKKLGDAEKAAAQRMLRERAKRVGDGNQSAERIIARLVVRSLSLDALNVIIDVLTSSTDEEIAGFGELFKGEDRWTLRQVAHAASLMKVRLAALEDLEECVADYAKNEPAIQTILEENPWIIADDFHSFRANRQIRTTLRTAFGIEAPKDSATTRRPDFAFILGDAASTSLEQPSRFLVVELKGPDQPLSIDLQNQAVRDARTFLKHRPGFAHVVLLGTEYDPTTPPDEEAHSPGVYSFRSMTYQRLLDRARFRLSYMLESVEMTKAEKLARLVVERQLDELVGIDRRTQGEGREPFRRLALKDVKQYVNSVPLYDLHVSAGGWSDAQLADELQAADPDDLVWVAPASNTRLVEGMFVARVVGESMNRKVPNGSYCLFRVGAPGSWMGRTVLVQQRDSGDSDAAGRYTIKVFTAYEDAQEGVTRIELRPDSTDDSIQPIVLGRSKEADVSVIGELVEVLADGEK